MGVLDGITHITRKVGQTAVTIGAVTKIVAQTVVKSLREDAMGIKETKEVLTAAFKMLRVARAVGTDGWQKTDAGLLITDPELMRAVSDAIAGAEQIPTELNRLTFGETIELATFAMDGLQEFTHPLPPAAPVLPVITERKIPPAGGGQV